MNRISVSPHIHSGNSTKKIMLNVIIALLPTLIWGVYSFGFRALLVVAVSVIASVFTEYLLGKTVHEYTIWDLSAVVTGLLVGLNMSPSIPLFIPIIASIFAIAVAKWTFGGLGSNWANPALAGRVFVFFSFTNAMGQFTVPRLLQNSADIVSSATPLSLIKTSIISGNYSGMTTNEILAANNYPISNFAQKLSETIGINPYTIDAIVGNMSGCIGEVSAILLVLGGIYLLAKKIISWHIPVSYFLSYCLLTWVFGGIPNGLGFFSGEPIVGLLRGSILIAAFFMATDMVTTPVTGKGMFIFGLGCGSMTFLFRTFGSLPAAASVSILMMNMVTPTIDKFVKPKVFGSKEKIEEVSK